MKHLIEKCETLGYRLTIDEERLIAIAVKIKSKARFPKPEFNYRFRGIEQMTEYINQFILNKQNILADRIERKEIIKKTKEQMENPYKVGQILYDSWGWEQTNIDFYKVIETGKKSIKIQKIASKYAKYQPSGNSPMSAYVVPDSDSVISEPIQKRLVVSVYNNTPRVYIKSNHGSFSEYTYGDKGIYESWYA